MKQKTVKVFILMLCICATVLGSAFCVRAEELEEVITGQHDLPLPTANKNAGYVYLDAEVPNGWGGEIQVTFHSRATGKDHTCTMSYLENEYHTGLFLPAGAYQVASQLTMDDGLCRLKLKDSTQETIQVQKGEDLYLTVLAEEIPEEEPIPTGTAPIVLPKPQEEYQDLPTAAEETQAEETEAAATITPEEEPQQHSTLGRVFRILAIILVIVVAILAIAFFVLERRDPDSI